MWQNLPNSLKLDSLSLSVTALFKNMRILQLEDQPTFAFFAAVNHLSGPLSKQNFTLTRSKAHGLCLVAFDPFCVFCDCNYDWRQRKTQLWRRLLNLRVRMFVKSAVRQHFQAIFTLYWTASVFVLMWKVTQYGMNKSRLSLIVWVNVILIRQGHPTTIFEKISVRIRKTIWDLEFSEHLL